MDTPQDLAAVEALLADRDALHGWIARLDEAGSSVPTAVRARVRDDYERRLDGVTDRLREHADTIASKLAEDRDEHADLLARATSAREALAEAELRFAVGEYDQGRFDEERKSHASDIESYEVSLAAAAERIARLQDVHALVHRAPRTPEAPVVQDAAPVQYLDASSPAMEAGDGEPPAIGIGELAPDDADQLLAIFDDGGMTGAPDDAGHGALSFRPSGAGADDHTAMRSAPAHRTPPEPVRMVAPEVIPVPDIGAFDDPSPRHDTASPSEAGASIARTVRCGECGAMNKPMEWYCEKCGAELTAV